MAQYIESLDFPQAPQTVKPQPEPEVSWLDAEVEVSVATYQAYQILYYAFIALFAIAGVDKFLHLLASWDLYASPGIARIFGMSTGAVAVVAGVIEVLVAIAVALKPRIGSWMATVWMWLVMVNLFTVPSHLDLVLLTAALSAAGVAFTRLSAECN